MLVLSRKVGEKIVIGDNITVVVQRVSGNRISLGIEAPADVRIVRGELSKDEAKRSQENPRSAKGVDPASAVKRGLAVVGLPTFDFSTSELVHRAR